MLVCATRVGLFISTVHINPGTAKLHIQNFIKTHHGLIKQHKERLSDIVHYFNAAITQADKRAATTLVNQPRDKYLK